LRWIPALASALVLALGMGAVAPPPPAGPDGTQLVWTSADSGPGSLRQAIADAASGDILYFGGNLSGQTITLSSTLVITKNLTIDAVGLAVPVAISGNNAVRVVLVSNNARVTLANLTLTTGDSGSFCLNVEPCGGGLKLDAGSVVTLATSTVFSNVAYIGGGIVSRGTLTVLNSTISGNVANSSGGGIANLTPGALYVLNSTFSGNTALNGSAIFNEDALTLLNGTLSGNTSTAA
jgi:hypothetical protein